MRCRRSAAALSALSALGAASGCSIREERPRDAGHSFLQCSDKDLGSSHRRGTWAVVLADRARSTALAVFSLSWTYEAVGDTIAVTGWCSAVFGVPAFLAVRPSVRTLLLRGAFQFVVDLEVEAPTTIDSDGLRQTPPRAFYSWNVEARSDNLRVQGRPSAARELSPTWNEVALVAIATD